MGLEKMKIVILFLAIIAININVTNQMCRTVDIAVNSSIQEKKQTFGFDVKNIQNIKFGQNEEDWKKDAKLIPLTQGGLVINKTDDKPGDETHLKYLRNEDKTIWIPYSYIDSWTRNGFELKAQMTRTSTSTTEKPMVNFEFINDANLGNVSDQDMNDFLSKISDYTKKRQTVKSNLKTSVLKAQNSYLQAKALLDKTKADNKNLKKRIEELEAQLQVVIKKISEIDSVIEKTVQDVAVKRGLKSDAQSSLETVTNNLKTETSILVKWEKEYAEWKPISTADSEEMLKWALTKMNFPTKIPDEFRQEFTIAKKSKADHVDKSYTVCDNKKEHVVDCFNQSKKDVNNVQRRLR